MSLGDLSHLEVDRTGRRVVGYAPGRNSVAIWDDGGERVVDVGAPVDQVALSADGALALLAHGARLELLDLATGTARWTVDLAAPARVVAAVLDSGISRAKAQCARRVTAVDARTHLYDDYAEGSYHANKLDLARGLPAEGERCGVRMRGLLLFGPVGPLWTFHIIAFIDEGDQVRVNSLVMPHARITGKGSTSAAGAAIGARRTYRRRGGVIPSADAPLRVTPLAALGW